MPEFQIHWPPLRWISVAYQELSHQCLRQLTGRTKMRALTLMQARFGNGGDPGMKWVNKVVHSCAEALADLSDGATVMVGGFGSAGLPAALISAVLARGVKDLSGISNNSGSESDGASVLIADRQ